MQPEILTWLTPLPPIVSFFLIVLFARRSNRLSHTIAVGAMLISWALAMAVFIQALAVEHLGEHPFASSIA
jgi:NADH-quinone oxidoreductase subunit L